MTAPRTSAHHIGVRVSNIDVSTRFYEQAFGGTLLVDMPDLDEAFIKALYNTPDGVGCHCRLVRFENWSVELLQFTPSEPLGPTYQPAANIMHFAIYTQDLPGLVASIEKAGGSICTEMQEFGPYNFIYTHDPDGNVLEIINGTPEECAAEIAKMALPQ